MYYLTKLPYLFFISQLFMGCSPDIDSSTEDGSLNAEHHNASSQDLNTGLTKATSLKDRESVISKAMVRYEIMLSEDEKEALLNPVKEALSEIFEANDFENLKSKIDLRLDIREAELLGDLAFDSLLSKHLGTSFSKAEWENTVLSVPDLNTLEITRRKLGEQFPKSSEDALSQVQDSLFRKALTEKLRDEITKHITAVSPSEVEEFYSQYRKDSPTHIYFMSKHENAEAAALELKRDQYWNRWLALQERK